jgi:hypothetical protein
MSEAANFLAQPRYVVKTRSQTWSPSGALGAGRVILRDGLRTGAARSIWLPEPLSVSCSKALRFGVGAEDLSSGSRASGRTPVVSDVPARCRISAKAE